MVESLVCLGAICAEDWDNVESLVCFLKEFYDLTHRVSASSYVTSNFMILHVLKTMKVLNRLLSNTNFALKHMARQMQIKCEKYWGSSDKMNMLMFMCSMLDPCYKMIGVQSIIRSICEQESCPESSSEILMKTVKDLAYNLFDEYRIRYSPLEDQEIGSHSNAVAIDENDSSDWLEEINEDVEGGMLDRDDLSRSEFDQYLNESREKKKVDILHWWKLNGPRYPIVARMARDMLAIPISTVPSESAFSTGGRHLSEYRSSLIHQTVQALVCTQDWLRLNNRTKKDDVEDLDEENVLKEDLEKNCSIDINEGTFFVCS